MIGYIEGPPITEGSHHTTLYIKVRNVESRLWAYAPKPSGNTGDQEQTEPMDVRLESDNIQFDPNEIWKLVLVNSAAQQYTLQNTATEKYAGGPASPQAGDTVVQQDTSSIWSVQESSHSGWYTISPLNPAEAGLRWAGENALRGESVTIQGDLGNKSLWRLRDMGVASEHEGHDFFLKLLNRATQSHATVSSTSQRSLRVGEDAIVGDSREAQVAQDGSDAFWKFTRVDLHHWNSTSNSSDLLYRIRSGDTLRRTSAQYFVILNLATNKYAWAPDALASSSAVVQRDAPRVWKLIHLQDDTFTITPAGDGEDRLFWTHGQSASGGQITLQESTSGEAVQWKFIYGRP